MSRIIGLTILTTLVIIFLICGCAKIKQKQRLYYEELSKKEVSSILKKVDLSKQKIDSWEKLHKPLIDTIGYLKRKGDNAICIPNKCIKVSSLISTLNSTIERLPLLDMDISILKKEYNFYKLSQKTFFTGYFEMDVEASLERDNTYKYPIYGVPRDLKKVNLGIFHPRWRGQTLIYRIDKDEIRPYYSRREIDGEGKIKDKAEVLAWAKSIVDVYFLQIQGSGRLILKDGTVKFIGYASKNGRQYVSLGRYLIEKGFIKKEQGNLDGIVEFLKSRPKLLPEILFVNPSYVFFRFLDSGPVGAIGVKLTPLVSIAVDPDIIPLGSIGFYEVKLPGYEKEITGFFIAQDVGGAIDNNHVDLFCGFGNNARYIAGNLSQYGNIYLLLKKE